jgi:hypothetical protein
VVFGYFGRFSCLVAELCDDHVGRTPRRFIYLAPREFSLPCFDRARPLTAHVAAVCIEMPGRKRIVLALWMDTQQAKECQHAIQRFYYNRQHECRQLVVSVKDRSQNYVARAYEL